MVSKRTFLFLLFFACAAGSLQAQYIYTFAGTGYGAGLGIGGHTGDGGPAKYARMNACTGVCYDGAGNLYIADMANNVVRKVATNGYISTFAGCDTAGYSGDLGPATAAKLNKPYGVASDHTGNVYISDRDNHVIRKVSVSGTITTYAGIGGSVGYSGDLGPATAAELNTPEGIATDSTGNLYIADFNNHAVRVVWVGGSIQTYAGTGTMGFSGDGGPARLARLHGPAAVAVDPLGTVYVADYYNSVVRKIDASGDISTFAGTGITGYSGDGGQANSARLYYPSGVAVFGFGPVYISDQGNNAVRSVSSSGVISTVAGTHTNGYTGDGGMAVVAEISSPKGIAIDALNRLFIADYDNNVIRVVRSNTAVNELNKKENGLTIYPNPSNGFVTIQLPVAGVASELTVTDVTGRVVDTKSIPANASAKFSYNTTGLPAGSYIVKLVSGGNTFREKLEVY